MGRLFRREYGAGPLHLAIGSFSFLVAAYAVWQLTGLSAFGRVILWLGVAVIAHDFVLVPAYSAIARTGIGITRWSARLLPRATEDGAIDAMNHIRVPALISGILLLLFFPLIFGVAAEAFERTTGMSTDIYLGRWLVITAALFALSGLAYAVRRIRGFGR